MKNGLRIIGVVVVVSMLLVLATATQAQTYPTLDRTRSGTIVGNGAGAFDKYTLKHPGGGQAVTLRMTYQPVHPNAEKGIGFKVYGTNGKLVGVGRKVPGTDGVLELSLTTNRAAEYLVQVQNYYQGFRMSYTLEPQGVTAAQPDREPAAEAGTAQNPSRLVGLAEGQIGGNRAGSFDFYEVPAEPGQSLWIRMTYQPHNSWIARGVGFNVYHGGPNRVAEGQVLDGPPNTLWANLQPSSPSTYVVQVYNYIPGLNVDYDLEVTTQPAE